MIMKLVFVTLRVSLLGPIPQPFRDIFFLNSWIMQFPKMNHLKRGPPRGGGGSGIAKFTMCYVQNSLACYVL